MNRNKRLTKWQSEYSRLAQNLKDIGFTWPGTIQSRMLTCGKPRCVCLSQGSKHGPYYYWTTKVKNKTVAKLLTPDELHLLQDWIENRKKLEATLKKMNSLSIKVATILLSNKRLSQKLMGH